MKAKDFAEVDTGFPIYGLRFIDNNTVFACGGGGEGNNGIANKITAFRCSFKVSDEKRKLQKFREITLPANEDSPMCVEIGRGSGDDFDKYSIFVGCNQSTELLKSMNINNNLRKYIYTEDEHLKFQDAVQFDNLLSAESIGEYPKIINLSTDASVGGMMTSRIPSEIFIFRPDTLDLTLRFKPSSAVEIKDFFFDPSNNGATLTYITASSIETISASSGSVITSSASADKKTRKILSKYIFSRVRYIAESRVVVAASLKSGKGAAILEYNLNSKKVIKEKLVSKKMKGIVAIDVSPACGLTAVAGSDCSVVLIKLSDFRVFKTYPQLHKFAITSLSFSTNGRKLATGSASNTLNVLSVPTSSGGIGAFFSSLFRYVFLAVLVMIFSSFIQHAHQNGDLAQYIDLSKKYGGEAFLHAQHFKQIALKLSQKYGSEGYKLGQHYGKIGYHIAKKKAHEGIVLLNEQINKRTAADENLDLAENSYEPEWHTAATEVTSTSSTFEADLVSQITKNIDSLTAAMGEIDTSSIISEAIDGITIVSGSDTSLYTSSADSTSNSDSEISKLTVSESKVTDELSKTAEWTLTSTMSDEVVSSDTKETLGPILDQKINAVSSYTSATVSDETISTPSVQSSTFSSETSLSESGIAERAQNSENVESDDMSLTWAEIAFEAEFSDLRTANETSSSVLESPTSVSDTTTLSDSVASQISQTSSVSEHGTVRSSDLASNVLFQEDHQTFTVEVKNSDDSFEGQVISESSSVGGTPSVFDTASLTFSEKVSPTKLPTDTPSNLNSQSNSKSSESSKSYTDLVSTDLTVDLGKSFEPDTSFSKHSTQTITGAQSVSQQTSGVESILASESEVSSPAENESTNTVEIDFENSSLESPQLTSVRTSSQAVSELVSEDLASNVDATTSSSATQSATTSTSLLDGISSSLLTEESLLEQPLQETVVGSISSSSVSTLSLAVLSTGGAEAIPTSATDAMHDEL